MKALRIFQLVLGWLLAGIGVLGLVGTGLCAGIGILGRFAGIIGILLPVALCAFGVFLLGRYLIGKSRPSSGTTMEGGK